MALVDRLLQMINSFAPGLEPKYNKFYVGLAKQGRTNNFAIFKPRKRYVLAEIRVPQSDAIREKLEGAGLEVLDYAKRSGRYRMRLTGPDLDANGDLLTSLMQGAFQASNS